MMTIDEGERRTEDGGWRMGNGAARRVRVDEDEDEDEDEDMKMSMDRI